MPENFPNGEGKRQKSSGSTESPNEDESKETQPRHIIIKMAKVKDKQRILKAARGKQLTAREFP